VRVKEASGGVSESEGGKRRREAERVREAEG
jgi:hypothetical protein